MFYSIRIHRSLIASLLLCCLWSISTFAGSRVKLAWDTNPEVRVAGYRIYRTEPGKAQILLNKDALLPEPSYMDTDVVKGGNYRYSVSAVDSKGQESPFSNEIDVTIEPRHVKSDTFVPSRLSVDQSFTRLLLGTSLVNLQLEPTAIRLHSVDANGVANGFDAQVPLGPLAGFKSLMNELISAETSPATLVATGEKGAFEPVFTMVDSELKRLDGLTGTGEASRVLYFPVARQITGVALYSVVLLETTVICLSNPDAGHPATAKLEVVDRLGRVTHTSQVEIRPNASKVRNLLHLFGTSIREGYVKVTSDIPIQGFEMFGFTQQSVASLWGLSGERTRSITLPYFFAGAGADTQVRLVNLEDFEVTAHLGFRLDADAQQQTREVKIPAKGMLVENIGTLLGLPQDVSHTGQLEVVTTGNDGTEEVYGRVAGVACYNASSQKAKATARFHARPSLGFVLPAVLQSAEDGYFTALSLSNPGTASSSVEIQALDNQGNLVREHSLVLSPNERIADVLDGAKLFGTGFRQTDGQLRIRSTQPLFASALVGNRAFDFFWGIDLAENDGE